MFRGKLFVALAALCVVATVRMPSSPWPSDRVPGTRGAHPGHTVGLCRGETRQHVLVRHEGCSHSNLFLLYQLSKYLLSCQRLQLYPASTYH